MPLGHTSNKMLSQAEEQIQAKVPAKSQSDLARVVNAGLTIMYSSKLRDKRNERIAQTTDPAKDAGEGAARLLVNLYQQSNKTMPVDIAIPASMIFAFEYLDLLAQAGKAEITPDLLAKTTMSTANSALEALGIKKDILSNMINASQKPQPAAPQGILAGAQGA